MPPPGASPVPSPSCPPCTAPAGPASAPRPAPGDCATCFPAPPAGCSPPSAVCSLRPSFSARDPSAAVSQGAGDTAEPHQLQAPTFSRARKLFCRKPHSLASLLRKRRLISSPSLVTSACGGGTWALCCHRAGRPLPTAAPHPPCHLRLVFLPNHLHRGALGPVSLAVPEPSRAGPATPSLGTKAGVTCPPRGPGTGL